MLSEVQHPIALVEAGQAEFLGLADFGLDQRLDDVLFFYRAHFRKELLGVPAGREHFELGDLRPQLHLELVVFWLDAQLQCGSFKQELLAEEAQDVDILRLPLDVVL